MTNLSFCGIKSLTEHIAEGADARHSFPGHLGRVEPLVNPIRDGSGFLWFLPLLPERERKVSDMTEPTQLRPPTAGDISDTDKNRGEATVPPFEPSNSVHARVGDLVLYAARGGIRRGLRPEDVIREIMADHQVRLNLGELRLLLASRDRSNRGAGTRTPE